MKKYIEPQLVIIDLMTTQHILSGSANALEYQEGDTWNFGTNDDSTDGDDEVF